MQCGNIVSTDDNFDLFISEKKLSELAPQILDTLREFVGSGLCRQSNTVERKMLAARFEQLALAAMDKFPELKLNHAGAKTFVTDCDETKCDELEREHRHRTRFK